MKLLKTTVVLTLVALVCGALIGATQFITGPIIQENSARRAAAVYLEYFEDLSEIVEKEAEGKYVYSVLEVKNNKNEVLGYIFKGKDTNGYGFIDVIVVTDSDGALIGAKILETGNTVGIYDKHVNDDGSLKAVVGDSVGNLDGVEAQSGATVTAGSLNAILREIRSIGPDFIAGVEAEATLYEKMFGLEIEIEEDGTFIKNDIVDKKEIVKDGSGNILGYVYTGTDFSDVDIPGHGKKESITLSVGVDLTGKIKGVYTVESNHTPGFYEGHLEDIAALKDIDVDDLKLDDKNGATLSFDVLNRILNAVKESIIFDGKSAYEQMFGDNVTVSVDNAFIVTENVIKKEIIKDSNGNTIGYAYTAEGLSEIDIPGHGKKESITLLVGIGLDGKVKGTYTLETHHTPGFYKGHNKQITALRDINLNDLNVDEKNGATISFNLINKLLNAIKDVEALP